jgi:hypothetical protein
MLLDNMLEIFAIACFSDIDRLQEVSLAADRKHGKR